MTETKRSAKILVAEHAQAEARLVSILSGHRSTYVHTLAQAREALGGQRFDLLLLGLQFDQARMFDVLSTLRRESRHRALPVVCIHALPTFEIPPALAECARVAARAMGAIDFVDLCDPRNAKGAERRMCDLLEEFAEGGGPVSAPAAVMQSDPKRQ